MESPIQQTSIVGWGGGRFGLSPKSNNQPAQMPDMSAATAKTDEKLTKVNPRVITVGCWKRAKIVSQHLDNVEIVESNPNIEGYNGTYKGVGVSVIPIGMGAPMMDLMMRELARCESGPLAVVRLGTCGITNKDLPCGTVMCAGKGSMYVYVNYSHFSGCFNHDIGDKSPPYLISRAEPCDEGLNKELLKNLKVLGVPCHDGLNACAETFYACQGRKDEHFDDKNEAIVPELLRAGVDFVEMETHQLFHLGRQRKQTCKTAACAIGIVNRTNDAMTANISADQLKELESSVGKACLEALITTDL